MSNQGEAKPQGQVQNQVQQAQPQDQQAQQQNLPPDPTANHINTPPDPNQEPGTLQPGQVEGEQLPTAEDQGTQNTGQQANQGQAQAQGNPQQ